MRKLGDPSFYRPAKERDKSPPPSPPAETEPAPTTKLRRLWSWWNKCLQASSAPAAPTADALARPQRSISSPGKLS